GKIVTSIVEDLLMPPVGRVLGNLDFSNLYIPLSDKVTPGLALAEAKKLGPVFAYGNFISITINFLIVAFCIISRRQRNQQTQAAKDRSAGGEGLPGLHDVDPDKGDALPALHDRSFLANGDLTGPQTAAK